MSSKQENAQNKEEETSLLMESTPKSSLNKSHLQLECRNNDFLNISSGPEVESPTLLFLYMMLAGLISQLPFFMMLSEAHVFRKKFKKFHFGFFVLMPTYASIPYSVLGGRLLQGMKLTTKININIVGSSFFMVLIYVFYFFVPFKDEYSRKPILLEKLQFLMILKLNLLGFLFVLGLFFLAYIFTNMLQSLYVGFVGSFHEKFSSVYYTFQPCSYLLVMIIKTTVYNFKFKKEVDVKYFLKKGGNRLGILYLLLHRECHHLQQPRHHKGVQALVESDRGQQGPEGERGRGLPLEELPDSQTGELHHHPGLHPANDCLPRYLLRTDGRSLSPYN